ncbi:hypothetical protein FRC07_010968 [Ceratobasidium sp. 392]|nr:hypothetical protein FRC07_010968 [Ceratobasidium sp. 392]
MLYDDEVTGENDHLFRHKFLFRLFRACAFGPSSVSNSDTPVDPRGQHVLGKMLGLKEITPGAIAFSAILARWCLSPDVEFSEKGKSTGIEYKKDYEYYKMLIIEGLRTEKEPCDKEAIQGPFMRLMNDWNKELFPHRPRERGNEAHDDEHSEPSDIENAMAQIRRGGQRGE